MSSGPVVASDVGGIPEMIQDAVTRLVVPAHDAGALAGSIIRLLTQIVSYQKLVG